MDGFFAGLDVSTQSTKLVVIDAGAGTVIHVDVVNYDEDLPHYGTRDGTIPDLGEGVSESDPRMWLEAVDTLLGRLKMSRIRGEEIRALAVSGQQHGLVALDADGELARPTAKLWNDFSTHEECQLLTDAVGGDEAMIAEVGNTQRTGYTAPKILHLKRHEPENYERAATLFLVHNYINWYLTGGPDGGVRVMEPGDTSGTALWHPRHREFSGLVLAAISPELRSKLPPVRSSDETIGTLAPALAERFGLSPTCRIDAGSGDNMYGAIGTGNYAPGIVTVSLGTSGTAYTFMEEPFIDPTGEIAAFCDATSHWLPLLCVSNMANGYAAVRREFDLDHEAFDDLVQKGETTNGSRILVPWYEGERTPDLPLAAPVCFGFSPGDFTPENLCRAVLDGHVLNLWAGFSRMPVEPRQIHLTGGLTRSRAWGCAISEIFGAETVPVEGEGAALGAAIHAAWVWFKEADKPVPLAELAEPLLQFDTGRRCRPRPETRAARDLQKRLYLAVTSRLRGLEGEDPFALRHALLTLNRENGS